MRRTRIVAAVTAVTAAAATASLGVVTTADAAPAAKPQALAKHLLSPLSVATRANGTVYVTQNFAGQLMKVRPGHQPRAIYQSKDGHEVGGVSVRRGVVWFTETASDAQGNPSKSWLKRITRNGHVVTVANIRRYENRRNPDKRIEYGFRHISRTCANRLPDELGPASYHGLPDSHPYASYAAGGRTYVADAGMNAVLSVTRAGRIRTVAVLPGIPFRVTRQAARAQHLPRCTVGKRYWFEAVPTDVERGPNGNLYVSSLPGGPEDPSLGARGSVFRVQPRLHRVRKVVAGLAGPVGVAVAGNGDMYVSQLFGGEISKIRWGSSKVRTFRHVNLPGDVELRGRSLYASVNVLPPEGAPPAGKLVRYRR